MGSGFGEFIKGLLGSVNEGFGAHREREFAEQMRQRQLRVQMLGEQLANPNLRPEAREQIGRDFLLLTKGDKEAAKAFEHALGLIGGGMNVSEQVANPNAAAPTPQFHAAVAGQQGQQAAPATEQQSPFVFGGNTAPVFPQAAQARQEAVLPEGRATGQAAIALTTPAGPATITQVSRRPVFYTPEELEQRERGRLEFATGLQIKKQEQAQAATAKRQMDIETLKGRLAGERLDKTLQSKADLLDQKGQQDAQKEFAARLVNVAALNGSYDAAGNLAPTDADRTIAAKQMDEFFQGKLGEQRAKADQIRARITYLRESIANDKQRLAIAAGNLANQQARTGLMARGLDQQSVGREITGLTSQLSNITDEMMKLETEEADLDNSFADPATKAGRQANYDRRWNDLERQRQEVNGKINGIVQRVPQAQAAPQVTTAAPAAGGPMRTISINGQPYTVGQVYEMKDGSKVRVDGEDASGKPILTRVQ